jgi:protein phosphatase
MADDPIHAIFQSYQSMFGLLPEEVSVIGDTLPIPKFPASTILHLFDETKRRMAQSTPLVKISSPCVIVGDLHGNFHDLMRIFTTVNEPFAQRYLFLGDYVDRGEYSLDVLVILFAFYCLYPGQCTLLRGNHEFPVVNEAHGFMAEIVERYGDDRIWRAADAIFQWLPIAAVVDERCLCLHGGIGPGVRSLADIASIRLPLANYDDLMIASILWSDPSEVVPLFGPSLRGTGCVFGALAVSHFLTENNLECLIRAHECVKHGISLFARKQCLTIFSSSNYSGENSAAFVEIHPTRGLKYFTLEPQTFLKRSAALFAEPEERKKRSGVTIGWPVSSMVRMGSKSAFRSSRALPTMPRGVIESTTPLARAGRIGASASQILPALDGDFSLMLNQLL